MEHDLWTGPAASFCVQAGDGLAWRVGRGRGSGRGGVVRGRRARILAGDQIATNLRLLNRPPEGPELLLRSPARVSASLLGPRADLALRARRAFLAGNALPFAST